MKVVDTNVIAYFFLGGEKGQNAKSLFKEDSNWVAPILWRSEFRNVLTQYLRRNMLSAPQIRTVMNKAEQLFRGSEYRVPSPQVFDLVENSTCSAYDCEFVALAKDLGIMLVTNDGKLLRDFPTYTISLLDYKAAP